MNKAALSCALICSCLDCLAQTNAASAKSLRGLYSLPPIKLRQEETVRPAPRESKPTSIERHVSKDTHLTLRSAEATLPDPPTTNSVFTTETTDARRKADDLELHHWLLKNGYLQPRPPESDNRLVRFMDNTFRPEVIHFRKVSFSCSIVTAIKRKNPLCLLNPIPLNVSW